jgi:RNA polymerase sigma factor (sigma-70 family)
LDFTQTVWRSFFRRRNDALRFTNSEDRVAFLKGMARNKVAEEVRNRLVRRNRNINNETSLEQSLQEARQIPDYRAPAADSLFFRERLERFLATLSEQDRRIVELRLQGLTNRETAAVIGIAETTVWRFWKKHTAATRHP